jgi:hypothetical protein
MNVIEISFSTLTCPCSQGPNWRGSGGGGRVARPPRAARSKLWKMGRKG